MNTSDLRPPTVVALAWRQTLRDFRAGELRLLAVAVVLAVAALCAVGFFADRLSAGLARDARQLLGGDAVVNSDQPSPPELLARLHAFDDRRDLIRVNAVLGEVAELGTRAARIAFHHRQIFIVLRNGMDRDCAIAEARSTDFQLGATH